MTNSVPSRVPVTLKNLSLGSQSSSAFNSQSTTQLNEATSDGHVLPSNVQIAVVATSVLGEIVIADTQSTLPTEESTKASDRTSWFDAFNLFKDNFENGDRVLCSIEDLIPSHPDFTYRVSFRGMKVYSGLVGVLSNFLKKCLYPILRYWSE